MEFNLELWLQELTKKLFDTFNDRVKFVGLQGSYRRNEASANSDIDVVIILDKLLFEDLDKYKEIAASMPFSEKACGFISGEKEIYNWPKHDLFQLINDTASLYGDLADFTPKIEINDVINSVKINAANLYHQMCHCYVFENKNIDVLKFGYKSSLFILQSKYYVENSKYIDSKKELVNALNGEDKEILLVSSKWDSLDIENNINFYFEKIIDWASKHI